MPFWKPVFEGMRERLKARGLDQAAMLAMLLDAGWQKGALGTEPDPQKFPDFAATCRALKALGLEIGVWVSSSVS